MPAYKSSSKKILKFIEENKLVRGDRLPSEAELAEMLEVGRLTLREAMNALKQEGIIYSVQGKGTFVGYGYQYIANSLNINESITEMIESSGYTCNTAEFSKNIVKADDNVANGLGVPAGSDVLMCERVRLADNVPVVYSIDYLAAHLASPFLSITDENVSLYDFIEEKCGIEIGQCLTEITPIVADSLLAHKLDVPENTPLLKFFVSLQNTAFEPIIYAVEYLRADKFKFIINRRRQ